jgi:serine protease Do
MAPGSAVKLGIRRKGEDKTLTLTLAKMPKEQQQASAESSMQEDSGASVPNLGLTVAPAKDVAGAGSKGVVVTAVDPDGAAAEHGVQSGDVILEVGGKAVSNVSEVQKAVTEARDQGKRSVLLRMQSGDNARFVALPVGHA